MTTEQPQQDSNDRPASLIAEARALWADGKVRTTREAFEALTLAETIEDASKAVHYLRKAGYLTRVGYDNAGITYGLASSLPTENGPEREEETPVIPPVSEPLPSPIAEPATPKRQVAHTLKKERPRLPNEDSPLPLQSLIVHPEADRRMTRILLQLADRAAGGLREYLSSTGPLGDYSDPVSAACAATIQDALKALALHLGQDEQEE